VSVPENNAGLCCPAMLFYETICISLSRDVGLYDVVDIGTKRFDLVVKEGCVASSFQTGLMVATP
jgi:hypothetical protein